MIIYVNVEITKNFSGIVERVSNREERTYWRNEGDWTNGELPVIELIWMLWFGDMHWKTEDFQ